MEKRFHEMITYSEEYSLISSSAFHESVVHLIRNEGIGSFSSIAFGTYSFEHKIN